MNGSTFETIASWIAALAATGTLFWSVYTKKKKKKLDKLASVDKANAEAIVERRETNEACRKAYNDYKTLIARLEHFAVGIEQGAFDLDMVDKLAGEHLIYLLPKIEPIIDAANEHVQTDKYYQSYVKLVERLRTRHM